MYDLIRPLLFSLDAERAHELSLNLLDHIPRACFKKVTGKPVRAMGIDFLHPIGLAAGLDKNGAHLDGLSKLGFSFLEIGTVTPRPQPGNPKPRLFRLPKAQAIINRMGFNNLGVEKLIDNIGRAHYRGVLGINIGKNKETPLNKAAQDYLDCLEKVYAKASYVTINISSPNTPDLRILQQEAFLADLLNQLTEEQKRLSDRHQKWVPLVVKLSPDESIESLKQMAELILKYKIEGIIATNTTCSREAVAGIAHANESGGLSGQPLASRSLHCLRTLKQEVGDAITLISAGGIDNPKTAQERLQAGANLLQIYSGLIYKGPNLVYDLALDPI